MYFSPPPLLYKQTHIYTCTCMHTNKYVLQVFYIQVVITSFSCIIPQTQSVLSFHLLFFLCGILFHRKTKSYFWFFESLLVSLLQMGFGWKFVRGLSSPLSWITLHVFECYMLLINMALGPEEWIRSQALANKIERTRLLPAAHVIKLAPLACFWAPHTHTIIAYTSYQITYTLRTTAQ